MRAVVKVDTIVSDVRAAVLELLDLKIQEVTGCDDAKGWRDSDLKHLIPAIDAHVSRIVERFNDPESDEPGSAVMRFESND